MLRAATLNIATAYGKEKDLGTLEPGKIADLLILDRNPLESAEHYRSIHCIIKDGALVDRDALPTEPLLTRPLEHAPEEAAYVPFFNGEKIGLPMCRCGHL
jgi:adenine deaminase